MSGAEHGGENPTPSGTGMGSKYPPRLVSRAGARRKMGNWGGGRISKSASNLPRCHAYPQKYKKVRQIYSTVNFHSLLLINKIVYVTKGRICH